MGVKHFSCETLALEEIRDALREAKQEGNFVALLGDNKNVLGFGFVDEVNDATVELELELGSLIGRLGAVPGVSSDLLSAINSTNSTEEDEIEATVSLCCVCSVVTGDPVVLFIIGLFLGYVTIPNGI